MASTFASVTVLLIFVCLASGQDLQLSCPDKMILATVRHYNPVTLTCTVNKSAFNSVCNAITNVQFSFTNKDGSNSVWANINYDCNPPSGTFPTATSTIFPGEVKCNGDGTSYNMSFYPSLEVKDGNFFCDVICILKNGATKPTIVKSNGCKDVMLVDACGDCLVGHGCDESQDPPTCIQTGEVEEFGNTAIAVTTVLSVVIVVLFIIIILLCTQLHA